MQILLLGKTGVGKSAAGNTILGKNTFDECFSSESGTKNCKSDSTVLNGQKITLIDTPGLYDTRMKGSTLKKEIERLFNFSGDGIHVILLVMKLGDRFTEEEKNTVKWIQDNFGEEASKYTMVLFTHGDLLKGTIEDYLKKGETLKSLVEQCKGGYHVFNNNSKGQNQVSELLKKMKGLKEKNEKTGSAVYEKQMYDATQYMLKMKTCGKRALIGAAALGGIAGVSVLGAVGLAAAAGGTAAAAAAAAAGGTAAVAGGTAAVAGGTAAVAGGTAAVAAGGTAAAVTKVVLGSAALGGVGGVVHGAFSESVTDVLTTKKNKTE